MDARERHLRLLTETIEAVNSTLDLQEVLALVATKVASALGFGGEPVVRYAYGISITFWLVSLGLMIWLARRASAATFALIPIATLLNPFLIVYVPFALQEGVCGGLRIFVLGRVLSKDLRVRTAIISEFVLMFCAGVSVEPFHVKRSTRLPNNGTCEITLLSAPVVLSVQ